MDAHIGALLKLKQGVSAKNESETYRIGESYVFDAAHAILRYLVSGVEKTLTEREAGLLKMLCVKMGEVVKREVILSTFGRKRMIILHHAVWMFLSHGFVNC